MGLIPESQYHAQFSTTALSPTAINLKTYSGEWISPLGVFRANIKHEGQSHIGDAYVVRTTGPALFGRDWLQHIQLDWKAIQCHRLASPAISQPIPTQPDTDLGKLRQRYAVVFGEDRSHLKAHTGRLLLQDNATPKFLKARPLPYALRGKSAMSLIVSSAMA